jgi:NAD(P)-dependent dehydrogenase (short-subunit alcohol dehydrogenase family)
VTSVLITGAARGIGHGLVAAFASAGWDVAVTARRREDAEVVARALEATGANAIAAGCDVTEPSAVDAAVAAAVAAFGGLDAVVHNAVSERSSQPVDLEHAAPELWDEHASVALRGAWRCARAAFEPLREREGALLVLTSPAGISGSANLSFYAAVKGGQQAFVRSLAREWGPEGVRVNGLAPLAHTAALDDAFRADPDLRGRVTASIPLGRVGDPEHDIGPPAVFLCSDAARYITGQTLVVNGGRLTSA